MRGCGDNFLIWREPLRVSVAVDGMVVVGCEVVHVELVDFAVMVLKLDSSFRGCFCLEQDGAKEWTSG